MSQYNKVYANDEEYDNRFQTFINNADKVKGLNNNPHNVTFELNNFADWTSEEFATNLLGYIPSFESYVAEPLDNAPLSTAPSAFDWCQQGKCTPVKNQEQCGSCWAFATTENIESVHAIAGLGLPDLAPQQIVDCDRSASGCNGGDPAQAYRYVVSQGGLDNEKSYPYVGVQGGCRFHANDVGAKIKGEKDGYGGSENQMAANLAATAPFSIVVDAQQWQFYKSGVFKASQCGTSLDHAVVAVGYNIAEKYWRVRNSWSASWGESGFIRLEFGTNTCGMRSQVLTAVN
jgi:C1A family cysteine protease